MKKGGIFKVMAAECDNRALHCHNLLAHSTLLYECSSHLSPYVAWRTPEAPLRVWRMCYWWLKGLKSFLQWNDNQLVINYPIKKTSICCAVDAGVLTWLLKGIVHLTMFNSVIHEPTITDFQKIFHCMETNAETKYILLFWVPCSYTCLAWCEGVNDARIVICWVNYPFKQLNQHNFLGWPSSSVKICWWIQSQCW